MPEISAFLEYLRIVKKHSINTIKNYEIDILEFSEYINKNLLKIDKEDVFTYLKYLYQKNDKKSTISRKLSSLRVFYNYLLKEKLIKINYFLLVNNPKKDYNLPKYVKDEYIDKLYKVIDTNKPFGCRNKLIIRILYSTGIRVSELVNIKLKDINLSERTIKILGKGSKERIVVFGLNTYDDLLNYIDNYRCILDINNSNYLLLNKYGNKLSDRYVRIILDDIIKKACLDTKISPHVFRHTFATNMLNNGADLVSVKDLLGHSNLDTTSIYTHVSDDKIKEVYNMCHPRAHK